MKKYSWLVSIVALVSIVFVAFETVHIAYGISWQTMIPYVEAATTMMVMASALKLTAEVISFVRFKMIKK